jgi:ABC-type protease/lipase transport system fused ATPase/permease subunit
VWVAGAKGARGTRTVPLATDEIVGSVAGKWLPFPGHLAYAAVAAFLVATTTPVQAKMMGLIVQNSTQGENKRATICLVFWLLALGFEVIFARVFADAQSKMNSQAVAHLRRTALTNILSGGTEFADERIGFTILPGTYVVLFGSSGSGKSTLLQLLMRFRQPRAGSIEWDGVDINTCSFEGFRKHVGNMFQTTMILQGTIRENITFGAEVIAGAVETAAKMAEIADFINSPPAGFDTYIGGGAAAASETEERGLSTELSGEQMQRICLAGALYRNPSVLLLDEATSALDTVSEAAIIQTILKLRDTGITVISVSHHPSTAVEADEIFVLDQGVIAERGSYSELSIIEGGIFQHLVQAG